MLDRLPETNVSFEATIYPRLVDEKRLLAQVTRHRYYSVGSHERLAETEEFFARRKTVFLDRDGTVNVEQHYLSSVEGMELLPGAAAGVRVLNGLGWPVVIVSNQTVVARGDCSLDTLRAINQRMIDLLANEGAAVEGIYYCPHMPEDDCACRKPKTRLLENAARVFGGDLAGSFLVGDKCSDIDAGLATGAVTILVRTGHGLDTEFAGGCTPHYIVDDLRTAAERISCIIQKNEYKGNSHVSP